MSRIYLLTASDYEAEFANAFRRYASDVDFPSCPKCKNCKDWQWHRSYPFVIEWQPGSDVLADFTWVVGISTVVVSERVKDCLEKHDLSGCRLRPVEMFQNPKLIRPTRITRRTKKRIWLPRDDLVLWNLHSNSWCDLDLAKSGRTLIDECPACGWQTFAIKDNAPLVVDADTWDGSDIFHIREAGELLFISEKAREIFAAACFTNLRIMDRGEIRRIDR